MNYWLYLRRVRGCELTCVKRKRNALTERVCVTATRWHSPEEYKVSERERPSDESKPVHDRAEGSEVKTCIWNLRKVYGGSRDDTCVRSCGEQYVWIGAR